VQPARLNLRWHMLKHQQLQEMNFKGRTPVCGWLLYNYFDETLVFYNTTGQYIGAINSDGEWQNEDGINFANTQNIADATLKKFVDKLRSFHPEYRTKPNSGNNYLPQLKQAIRRGHENANPETNNYSQSTLRSQPLAIVRASLDLQLKGLPQANKSWRALNYDMDADGIDRSCREFTAVKFPIKLGEYRNLDDGLICYWTQDNQGVLSEIGYFPQSDVQDIEKMLDAANFNPNEHDYIDAIKGEGVANLHHCLEDPPLDLVILMDPEAPIHATTGIVPKKVLRLEPMMYQDAFEAIETSYFAAPLLTPRIPSHEHALPLPSGAWLWKQPYYGGHAIPKVSMDGTTQQLQLKLGISEAPTKLKQLKTALEAMEEITSLDIGSYSEDDVLYSNSYSKTTRELTIAGKQLTLTLAIGHEGDLITHTPTINLWSSGITTPEVTIASKAFTITLGDLETPTTVGQLKEVLEEQTAITSVQTTHDASEELIPDQLSQDMKLYLSGKTLPLQPKGDALNNYTLEVQYSEVGTLELPSVAVVDKQAFLTNEGNETEWNTLHSLEILRSDPEKPDSAYYYPPSQDPDETNIADWPFIREALEKSQRPSLSPLNQIGPCEQRVEAVEGYFKKIKLPDESVEQAPTTV
jgi:hypothetical protein